MNRFVKTRLVQHGVAAYSVPMVIDPKAEASKAVESLSFDEREKACGCRPWRRQDLPF
jgi:hypothetical protein